MLKASLNLNKASSHVRELIIIETNKSRRGNQKYWQLQTCSAPKPNPRDTGSRCSTPRSSVRPGSTCCSLYCGEEGASEVSDILGRKPLHARDLADLCNEVERRGTHPTDLQQAAATGHGRHALGPHRATAIRPAACPAGPCCSVLVPTRARRSCFCCLRDLAGAGAALLLAWRPGSFRASSPVVSGMGSRATTGASSRMWHEKEKEERETWGFRGVWCAELKFNKYCSIFVLFDKKFLILN
jgi:hypothetical protein